MNLPNYFLADLPPEATLTAAMVSDACQTLKRNRAQYLLSRSTQALVEVLCGVAESWLQPEYPFRKLALEAGPAATGFSRGTLANGLDNFFKQFMLENFNALLVQELGHARRLDDIVSNPTEEKASRGAIARGPELLAHITAGNIPNPTLMSISLGLLTRSAQFVKCASGASFLPRLFAHSLYEAEPKLGACLEIASWRGGRSDIEKALFEEADCATATGSDEALATIRHHVPARVCFLGYGHRLSFAYVAGEALSGFQAKKTVARAATDVVAWNQLGCLSPHVIYVEHGGGVAAEHFAEMLAEELARREETEPRGEVPPETAAAIASRRAFYEVRAAHSPETRYEDYSVTRFWRSENSTAWTVVYEEDTRFQLSCLNRFIYVKGVSDLAKALEGADSVHGKVSTVGVAASGEKTEEVAKQLSAWGVTRVCPLGQMQNPPLTWRHDGRPALGELVTWMDWEK